MSCQNTKEKGKYCPQSKGNGHCCWHDNITLLEEHRVNHMDHSISTFYVWPEHMDPLIVPLYVVTCNNSTIRFTGKQLKPFLFWFKNKTFGKIEYLNTITVQSSVSLYKFTIYGWPIYNLMSTGRLVTASQSVSQYNLYWATNRCIINRLWCQRNG